MQQISIDRASVKKQIDEIIQQMEDQIEAARKGQVVIESLIDETEKDAEKEELPKKKEISTALIGGVALLFVLLSIYYLVC